MSKVTVKPQLIRWARERSGVGLDSMIERFPKFASWESGEAQLTLRQLEDLAKKTLTPLGFFFLSEPPEDKLTIPDFRTAKDEPLRRPSPNLLETVQMMQRRQGWMREYLMDQGEKPLSFVGSASMNASLVEIASKIREVLARVSEWASQHATWTEALRALRHAAEAAGILVAILGLIARNYFAEFYREYLDDERRKASHRSSGGDFYATQDVRLGRRFAHAVVSAAKEGRLLYRDAYNLTGLYGQTFDRYAKNLDLET